MTSVLNASPTQSEAGTPSPSQKLRVCHVSLTLCTGGLERLLADFAARHTADQFELHFMAMRERGRFADEIEREGCPVSVLQSARLPGKVNEMRRYFRKHQIDVVHTHNTYPHIYATAAAKLAGVPVVINTRHGQRFGTGWRSRMKYRWASRFVDKIVGVSDDAAKLCVSGDGVSAKRVTRIWNGIDTSKFRYCGPSNDLHAVSVARLSPEKNYPLLLNALKVAHEKVPALKLTLIGDGPERVPLERLTDDLGLRDSVKFAGMKTNVPDLLPNYGFFVNSSFSEGISLTLLEAMAVGLPIVATSVGGNVEIVEQDRTGLLVPSDDINAMAAALVEMADRRADWNEIGRSGRDRVETHFEIDRMVRDYEELYRNHLQKKGIVIGR